MSSPVIPGYEILGKIAEGGMATVYKARQISLDRLVALKVLNKGLIERESDVERFRVEAQSAAKLRHPGLCQIYDAGDVGGTVYYAMEYVSGFSVGQLLDRKGELPERQGLLIAAGVARILDALWEKNRAIHCDIKPDNVLIDNDGTIRVTDFGVARFIGEMAHQLDSDYIVGTPNYVSPEQAQGLEDLDCRTDIYALGATLYHMLTGLMPFSNLEGDAALQGHCTDFLTDPQVLNPSISIEASCLLDKLMVKDRASRYAGWKPVLDDLEEVRTGHFPRGDLVPEGLSTVTRSPEREAEAEHMLRSMKPKAAVPGLDTVEVPQGTGGIHQPAPSGERPRTRRKVKGVPGKSRTLARRAGPRAVSAFFQMVHVGLWVGIAYGVSFWLLLRPAPVAPQVDEAAKEETKDAKPSVTVEVPHVSPRRVDSVAPSAPERVAPDRTAPTQEPAPREAVPERAPSRTQTPPMGAPDRSPPAETARPAARRDASESADRRQDSWSHPNYQEAMQLLQGADAALQRFMQERDARLPEKIESDCRRAIALLEELRPMAPPAAQIGERIRQGYQIIANTRRAHSKAIR